MIKTAELYSFILMTAFVSFLGFVIENVWLAFTKGYIDNRNMTFPFLLGYGLAVIGIFLFFGTPEKLALFGRRIFKRTKKRQRYLIYLMIMFVVVCAGEIILGKLVEKICGFEYWNYSALPLHITKYTSVFTSLGFAAAITFFMGFCFYPLLEMFSAVPYEISAVLSRLLSAVMIWDMIHSFSKMYKTRQLNVKWRKQIRLKNNENIQTAK